MVAVLDAFLHITNKIKQVYSVSARNLILSVPSEWEILQISVAESNFLGTWFLNGKTTERLSKDAAKKIPHHLRESMCLLGPYIF